MTEFYTPSQRQLQDEFDTRQLADRLAAIVSNTLAGSQTTFIESRDMFFLATIDAHGFPSSSYKGGAPGFVRVTNPGELIFPSYDGNGMFMSLGNIEDQARVGLLFIDFAHPQRLRVSGTAQLVREGALLASYPGADAAVQVAIERIWANCPRYVHTMTRTAQSPHVPDATGSAPFALWKRIDLMQEVLNANDRAKAQDLGLISVQEYEAQVSKGNG